MQALTAGPAACSTVGSGFPGVRAQRLRQEEEHKVDVAGVESKRQSTKVAGRNRRGRLEMCVTVL